MFLDQRIRRYNCTKQNGKEIGPQPKLLPSQLGSDPNYRAGTALAFHFPFSSSVQSKISLSEERSADGREGRTVILAGNGPTK